MALAHESDTDSFDFEGSSVLVNFGQELMTICEAIGAIVATFVLGESVKQSTKQANIPT